MYRPNKKITLLAATITASFSVTSVHAAGFRLPEISAVGVGTSNALVANTDQLGALPYNPANMAFHDKNGLVAGVTYIGYDLKVDTTVQGGGSFDSTGNDTFWVPNLYVMAPGYGKVSFGLGINSPFGLETGWSATTFPNFGPAVAAAPAVSRIHMLNINPNIAYKINNTTSFAVGVDLYQLRDLMFNTQAAKIEGRAEDFGWNIGFTKKVDNWNFGLSYRSSVTFDVNGTLNDTVGAQTSVEFPDMLQFGAFWQATDKWGIELDVERTGWSSFDQLVITAPAAGLTITSVNNWDDTWAMRLGAIYAINAKTNLLLGYSFDETGQPDDHFSARVPDNDRQLFSVGVTHDYGGWTLEASYMYVMLDDRTINSSTPYVPGVTTDANGTDAYDGTYESSVNLLSIGLSTKF
ncbi:MAG: outer membrane protein transport protein [Thiohalomonadales bacterium]|nr:outer membrane protein transport protein [Thiohalomonadales bacterium]